MRLMHFDSSKSVFCLSLFVDIQAKPDFAWMNQPETKANEASIGLNQID